MDFNTYKKDMDGEFLHGLAVGIALVTGVAAIAVMIYVLFHPEILN